MVVGVDTSCVDCGAPMRSCSLPAHCGCVRVEEMRVRMNEPLAGVQIGKEITEALNRGENPYMPQVTDEEAKKLQEVVVAANERQVGGEHYKTGGEEHWDRVSRLGLDYFQGQVTKYVERCWKKNGVEDLKKARHFLDKYIELAEAGAVPFKEQK